MPSPVHCPEDTVLQRFFFGQMSPAEVEAQAAHIDQCERCSQILDTLQGQDSLVEAMAAQSLGDYQAPGQAVDTLIQRLKETTPLDEVGAAANAISTTAIVTPPSDAPEITSSGLSAGVEEEHYDFLAPPEVPGELGRLGLYRIIRVLGAGGMGVVFQAFDPQLQRQVALKVMNPGLSATPLARQRFLREARVMAALSHDHVVPVFQVGADRDVPFLAMPLLKGESLEARLQRENKLAVADVLRIGREIAEGLAAAHEAALMHRDIKPSNVWLEGTRGRVKLLDFGLARPLEETNPLTLTGMLAGTPHYMAPEQAKGDAVNRSCDLFSLGSVLYRMSTGQLPFRGNNHQAIMYAVATETPKSSLELAPEMPQALTDLISRLLAKSPDDRPPSARAVVEAIEAIEKRLKQGQVANEEQPKAKVLPVFKPKDHKPIHHRVAVAASALFLVGLLGVTIYLSTRNGTLVVTVTEPDVKVFVDGQERITIDSTKVGRLELAPGDHEMVVKRGKEELYTKAFTLKSGGEATIEATWVGKQARLTENPETRFPPKRWIPPIPDTKDDEEKAVDLPADDQPAKKPNVEVNSAAIAREIFRIHCFECHGGVSGKKAGGIAILDWDLLVNKKKKVIPGKPEESKLVQLLEATDNSVMPPPGQKRLPPKAIEDIRRWIADGAPAFFERALGVDYELRNILQDINSLPQADRPYVRYFSSTHLLTAGATQEVIDQQRDALTKVINHLTWEKRLVVPRPIDNLHTIFAVDIRKLGWHKQYFKEISFDSAHRANRGLDLFDLVLLDYPYGVIYDSTVFDQLVNQFIYPSGMVRPIPSVRIDWFVSTATLLPLYEDLLRLPPTLYELEEMLGVSAKKNRTTYDEKGLYFIAKRAGMAESFVSRNNRVVERHPTRFGFLWENFDFKSSKGKENIFTDPIHLNQAGGEMIFTLPNGLQAYFVCDARGNRLDAATTEIVTDAFASDKTVRNGLSCIRCHDIGMKAFTDTVRDTIVAAPSNANFDRREALSLYPPQEVMDKYLKEDTDHFQNAMAKILGKRVALPEPLRDVSCRFLDVPLHLTDIFGELGWDWTNQEKLGLLKAFLRSRLGTDLGLTQLTVPGGMVRRDAWENNYDQIVANLNIGVPVVPLDGLVRKDFNPYPDLFDGLVTFKTNRDQFRLGDELKLTVTNKTGKPVYIELIGTMLSKGEKFILASDVKIEPGNDYTYTKKLNTGVGKDEIALFASDYGFPAGKLYRGYGIPDRVVHHFYGFQLLGNHYGMKLYPGSRPYDPNLRMVKRTLTIGIIPRGGAKAVPDDAPEANTPVNEKDGQ